MGTRWVARLGGRGVVALVTGIALGSLAGADGCRKAPEKPKRTVRGLMQALPGGPIEEVAVGVHEVPVEPPSVSADRASLSDDDLVLGVVVEGKAMAYPIRYLAVPEILDDRVGGTPIAPSW